MPTPRMVARDIHRLVACLVERGLAVDQNFPTQRALGQGRIEVAFSGAHHLANVLGDPDYASVYAYMRSERAYTVLMPDGALLQMSYVFHGNTLERHRLAFLPSPHLERFQDDPEIYLEDIVFAEVIARSVVPFPLRFDYDNRPGVHDVIHHPKVHLTLGQYRNCRIPVTAPLAPGQFIDFVLRNFYHTAFRHYAEFLPPLRWGFPETIHHAERSVVHVTIPRVGHVS